MAGAQASVVAKTAANSHPRNMPASTYEHYGKNLCKGTMVPMTADMEKRIAADRNAWHMLPHCKIPSKEEMKQYSFASRLPRGAGPVPNSLAPESCCYYHPMPTEGKYQQHPFMYSLYNGYMGPQNTPPPEACVRADAPTSKPSEGWRSSTPTDEKHTDKKEQGTLGEESKSGSSEQKKDCKRKRQESSSITKKLSRHEHASSTQTSSASDTDSSESVAHEQKKKKPSSLEALALACTKMTPPSKKEEDSDGTASTRTEGLRQGGDKKSRQRARQRGYSKSWRQRTKAKQEDLRVNLKCSNRIRDHLDGDNSSRLIAVFYMKGDNVQFNWANRAMKKALDIEVDTCVNMEALTVWDMINDKDQFGREFEKACASKQLKATARWTFKSLKEHRTLSVCGSISIDDNVLVLDAESTSA